ncbi:unnamed protein product [Pleuronectes platessa]|uniref:Uncharacterized protein n=1 Tax=Pleuronectes platessa TaxID=8262 RepID=A0A9N7Z2P4_PLEPL|nr:unnamed protein product [Pleuronectes platessa]
MLLLRQLENPVLPLLPLRGCAGELGLSQAGSPGISIHQAVSLGVNNKAAHLPEPSSLRAAVVAFDSGGKPLGPCMLPVTEKVTAHSGSLAIVNHSNKSISGGDRKSDINTTKGKRGIKG